MSTPQDLKDTVKDLSNATIQGHFYPMDIIQRHIELEEGLQERALQDYLQAANTLREDLEICANIDEAVRAEMLHNVDFLKAAIVRKGNIYSKRQHDVLNGLRSQQEQVGASLRQLDVEKDDLATRKASLAEEKAAFEGEEAELKNQQDELKKYDNLVAVLSSDFVHVKDVQGIKKQHGSELQALRDEHEEQIQQLNRQHSKDINNVEVRCRAENEAVNRHQAAKLQYAEFLSLFALEDLKEAQGYNLHLIKAVLNRTGCLPLLDDLKEYDIKAPVLENAELAKEIEGVVPGIDSENEKGDADDDEEDDEDVDDDPDDEDYVPEDDDKKVSE